MAKKAVGAQVKNLITAASSVNTEGVVLLRPYFRSDSLADALLQAIGFDTPKEAIRDRARVVAASFLAASYEILVTKNKKLLGYPKRKDYWADFPAVGTEVAKQVRQALETSKLITEIPGSGCTVFDDDGNVTGAITTLYTIAECVRSKFHLDTARFTEDHRVPVLVGIKETTAAHYGRKAEGRASPKMPRKTAVKTFERDFGLEETRIKKINEFYRSHPLVLDQHHSCCSVTRNFTQGSMSSGGRLFASYSYVKSKDRQNFHIDGAATAEVDVRASQLTLLCCLFNQKIGDTWEDLYARLPYVAEVEDQYKDQRRKEAKSVITELLGTGNHEKKAPSEELQKKVFAFGHVREQVAKLFPAIAELKPRGLTSDNFLTFHESEIIILAIEDLMEHGIPAYSMHDGLIVRQQDLERARTVVQNSWSNYCCRYITTNKPQMIYPAIKATASDGTSLCTSGVWLC